VRKLLVQKEPYERILLILQASPLPRESCREKKKKNISGRKRLLKLLQYFEKAFRKIGLPLTKTCKRKKILSY
jgi:hypothetical protein